MQRIALDILVVAAVICVAGWVNLPMPLDGDGALYQLGARTLADGGMLYRDFWDLKQPGIYLFHWLAGSTFGFTEVGLHSFELAYMLVFGVVQALILRRYFVSPWLATVTPLFTIGCYYAQTGVWHLTQPAVLLSGPLFCTLALLCMPPTPLRSALAGASAAVAMLFKVAVAPVILLLFFASWLIDRRLLGAPFESLWRERLLPAAVGAVPVFGCLIMWLHNHEALQPFLWVIHTWRPLALEVRGAHPVVRVVLSTAWFGLTFASEFLLAAFAWKGWQGLARERLFVLALVWLVGGIVSVVTEPFAGWEFDFLMVSTPLGILAVRGLQGLLFSKTSGIARSQRAHAATLVLALAAVPAGVAWMAKVRNLIIHAHLTGSDDHAYQRAVSPHYERVWQSTAFLREDSSIPGPIYVFGDPLIHTLSRRGSASTIHGWAWELQPAIIWHRLESELTERPPAFVFAEPGYDTMLTERSPTLRAMLDREYTIKLVDELGTWYAKRPPGGG